MRSDKSFIDFLRSGSVPLKAAVALTVGLIFVTVLFFITPEEKESEPEEEGIASLCSDIDGVGECRVTVSYREGGEQVYAVAVICEGADDPEVRARIVDLFTSLYGIGANRISILKISEKK